MSTRPTTQPTWATTGGTRLAPSSGQQAAGFAVNTTPPARWVNWLFGYILDWVTWLDAAIGDILSAAGITVAGAADTALLTALQQIVGKSNTLVLTQRTAASYQIDSIAAGLDNGAIGNPILVAVGESTGSLPYIMTSRDYGISWTVNSSPGFSVPQSLKSVSFANNIWVAVGNNSGGKGLIITCSGDPSGENWTVNTSLPNFGTNLLSVAYGNGKWVTVGSYVSGHITVLTATDPTSTWTRNVDTSLASGSETLYGVIYASSTWVMVGAQVSGAIAYIGTATDPAGAWTQNSTGGTTVGNAALTNLAYGNGYFVTSTATQVFVSTTPASIWTAATTTFTGSAVYGLAYLNGFWYATGADSSSLLGTYIPMCAVSDTANPGGTWTLHVGTVSASSATTRAVAAANKRIVMYHSAGYMYSSGETF